MFPFFQDDDDADGLYRDEDILQGIESDPVHSLTLANVHARNLKLVSYSQGDSPCL